jgi:hypothetical protein
MYSIRENRLPIQNTDSETNVFKLKRLMIIEKINIGIYSRLLESNSRLK